MESLYLISYFFTTTFFIVVYFGKSSESVTGPCLRMRHRPSA